AVLTRQLPTAGWLIVSGAVAAAVLAGGAMVALVLELDLPGVVADQPQRLIFLIFAVTIMAVVPAGTLGLRRAHEAALLREIDAARREAEKNRQLFEMETRYARARDLAASRRRELQHASHDLKQPLASLRLSLDALLADRDSSTRTRLADAFDYLDGLVSGLSARRDDAADATAPPSAADAGDAAGPAEPTEPYSVTLITGTIEQMFAEEAAAKGLAFTCTGADAVIERPVLPMLRLIANLTSNAIKHTAAGEVRVAAGPAEGAAAFVEVADTGPGLSADDLARLRQPGIKGEASEGSGWGLAIVDDLAAKLGAQVEFHTAPGAGMRVRILI
ncbi:MAG: HAMP domain-containing histidine kinase, partial [Rhodospirillaceae bacterium]|nr:HAMP domain-containing histidine kinase [Rhodospirillaceae bacterium]